MDGCFLISMLFFPLCPLLKISQFLFIFINLQFTQSQFVAVLSSSNLHSVVLQSVNKTQLWCKNKFSQKSVNFPASHPLLLILGGCKDNSLIKDLYTLFFTTTSSMPFGGFPTKKLQVLLSVLGLAEIFLVVRHVQNVSLKLSFKASLLNGLTSFNVEEQQFYHEPPSLDSCVCHPNLKSEPISPSG